MIKSPTSPAFHGVMLDAAVQKNAETVRLEERTRIARELHDTLLQTFQSASLYLGAALHGVPEDLPVRSQLDRTLEIMRQGITEGRNAIGALRSSDVRTSDLILALSQVPRSTELQSDIDFRVTVTGRPMQLPPEIRDEVYRIGREALTNAFCHSGAKCVQLTFQFSNNRLTVRIHDNGCGIDSRMLREGRSGHWGLATMQERAATIGGLLKIVSTATRGTEVELSIPINLNLEYSLPLCRRSLRPTGDGRNVYTTGTYAASWQPARKLSAIGRHVSESPRGPPPTPRKHDCRDQGVQQSIFHTESSERFDPEQQGAHTHLQPDAGHEVISATWKALFRLKRIVLASISLVIVVEAGWLIRDSAIYERTDEARVEARILPVSARVDGHVQQLNVVEGQMVHAGDVLAIIDSKAYDIAVIEARANLAYAKYAAASWYLNAAITVTTAYGGLNAAQAAVRNASVEVKNAELKLRADEAVLERSQIDGPAADAIVAADQQLLLQAQDKLLEAVRNLRTAQTAPQQASLAKVEAEAAEALVLQRQAELERAELNLSYTILRSPITGVVGGKRLELGQSVRVGQELIDIVSLDEVWITAYFKETQLDRLRPGQPVEIKIDAYGRTWRGHVTNLGGAAGSVFSVLPPKTSTGHPVKTDQRVPVRIDFDRPESQDFNADGMLKPGLSAESKVKVRWLSRVSAQSRLPALSGPIHGAKGVVEPLADFRG